MNIWAVKKFGHIAFELSASRPGGLQCSDAASSDERFQEGQFWHVRVEYWSYEPCSVAFGLLHCRRNFRGGVCLKKHLHKFQLSSMHL